MPTSSRLSRSSIIERAMKAVSLRRDQPEAQLLLCCARTRLDAEHAARAGRLLAGVTDWDGLRAVAERHGVVPLLYRNLVGVGPEKVPAGFLQQLQVASQATSLRNLCLTGELLEILKALDQAGILAVPFKGPVLAVTAYGSLALRAFGDLDIIVRERDVAPAMQLLGVRGYVLSGGGVEHHYRLFRAEGGVIVELHWQFTQHDWSELDFETTAERLVSIPLAGAAVPTLAPPDMLLALCLHGAKHFWRRLRWVCDVAESIRDYQPEDWRRLVSQAKRLKALRLLLLGLTMARDLLDAPLPESITRRIDSIPAVRSLAAQMGQHIFADQSVNVLWSELMPARRALSDERQERWRLSAAILRRQLAPTAYERELVRLPRALTPLYYPLRLLRLAIVHRLGLRRIAR